MAGEPRVCWPRGHYPRIRYYDGEREWYVYLHRLTAYAHGLIDSPFHDDGPTVHHVDHDKWNNQPENLEAREQAEHSRYHAEQNHENGAW